MNNWHKNTLGKICEEGNGVIRTGPFGSQLHQSDYSDIGTPVVMPRDIVSNKIFPEKIARIGPEHVKRLSKHILHEGDIIFGRRGDIGRQALVTKKESGWLCGTGCLRINLGKALISSVFLHYYLQQQDVISWIYNQAIGATMPNLNNSIIKSLTIKYPHYNVQQKIASILSAYDDLIENNLRRIKILEEMAKNLYREWFVKFRFPGHKDVQFADSPLGEIPEGWELAKVANILQKVEQPVKIKKKEYKKDGLIPIIDQGKEFIGGYTNDTSSLISNSLPLIVFGDHTRILKFVDFQFACGADGTQLLKSNNKRMPATLFYQALSSINLSDYAYARHFKFLKEELIILPAQSISKLFEQLTSPLHEQRRLLMQKNRTLRHTRDLLLPKLISGELDVSELNIQMSKEAV